MVAPQIDNLILAASNRVLIKPDAGDNPTTGVIVRRSNVGCGLFQISDVISNYDHVLFIPELAIEVNIDGEELLIMHVTAVMGLIPD